MDPEELKPPPEEILHLHRLHCMDADVPGTPQNALRYSHQTFFHLHILRKHQADTIDGRNDNTGICVLIFAKPIESRTK